MTHLEDGLLLVLRDGADVESAAEARTHLDGCRTCRERMDALEERRSALEASLSSLDAPFDLEAARAVVRARAFPFGRSGRRSHRGAWARAAGLVLFLGAAGAAAALPRSPVHQWLKGVLRSRAPSAAVEAPGPPQAASAAPTTTGVRLDVSGGPVRVVLRSVAPGTEVEVRWVDGTQAAIVAPEGSHFTSATGRLEARPAPGPVRVELPRSVEAATVEVGGHVYLTHDAGGTTVSGPVVRRDTDAVVFRVPAAADPGNQGG